MATRHFRRVLRKRAAAIRSLFRRWNTACQYRSLEGTHHAHRLEPLESRVLLTAELVSTNFDGIDPGNNNSQGAQISGNGSAAIFASFASDLIEGVTEQNFAADLYWFDLNTGERKLVNHTFGSQTTTPGDVGGVASASISDDGRWVAFASGSRQLVQDVDNNGGLDVFLWSAETGQITLVSRNVDGTATGSSSSSGPQISDDGSLVAFASLAQNLVANQTGFGTNVFLYSRVDDSIRLVSGFEGSASQLSNGDSFTPLISADGSTIAFTTRATNLLARLTDNNSLSDVYAYDVGSGTLRLVSGVSGSQTQVANSQSVLIDISAGGSVVTFETLATNLQGGAVVDVNDRTDAAYALLNGAVSPIYLNVQIGGTQTRLEASTSPWISPDGQHVVYSVSDNVVVTTGVHDYNIATGVDTFTAGVHSPAISNTRMIWRTATNELQGIDLSDRSVTSIEPGTTTPGNSTNPLSHDLSLYHICAMVLMVAAHGRAAC